MSHSLKVPYASHISYRVLNLVFSRETWGGAFLKGGIFQILSLGVGGGGGGRGTGANSKRDAYLKLGANSNIYGRYILPLHTQSGFQVHLDYS